MSYSQHIVSLKESLEKQNIEIVQIFSKKNIDFLNEKDPLNKEEHQK